MEDINPDNQPCTILSLMCRVWQFGFKFDRDFYGTHWNNQYKCQQRQLNTRSQ